MSPITSTACRSLSGHRDSRCSWPETGLISGLTLPLTPNSTLLASPTDIFFLSQACFDALQELGAPPAPRMGAVTWQRSFSTGAEPGLLKAALTPRQIKSISPLSKETEGCCKLCHRKLNGFPTNNNEMNWQRTNFNLRALFDCLFQ